MGTAHPARTAYAPPIMQGPGSPGGAVVIRQQRTQRSVESLPREPRELTPQEAEQASGGFLTSLWAAILGRKTIHDGTLQDEEYQVTSVDIKDTSLPK
jgi:hypothetical protein